MADEPGHQDLCDREAAFVARAIAEDLDLTRHLADAVASLRVCLAADESVRSGQPGQALRTAHGRPHPQRRHQVLRHRST